VFDQGLGDLFVVRVAGNVAAPSVIKSIEFAVGQFDVPLIVVMGHTNCGATQTPRANTCASAEELRTRTGLLGERVRRGELLVACAEYSLSTGVVDFFDRSL
jgi:carbonic anhydrase